jgi:hypothetical protein
MKLTRHPLDTLVWKDINETTICCMKTLRYFLLVLEAIVCLVECGHILSLIVMFQQHSTLPEKKCFTRELRHTT